MFDIGFWELVLVGVIALIVLGPQRLPVVARQVGLWVGRARMYARGLTRELERAADTAELRQTLDKTRSEFESGRAQFQAELRGKNKDHEQDQT